MEQGNFTGLADNYELYRVGYSADALRAIAALLPVPVTDAQVLDVGAGTGKWARMLADYFGHCVAVEPNDDMRRVGIASSGSSLTWHKGTGEATGQPSASYDWVTMASSFHWTDTAQALTEFHRLLRPKGLFTCLWNPRVVTGEPLLEAVEACIDAIVPRSSRKSSGSSAFVESIVDRLTSSGQFTDLIYIEARLEVRMTPEHYLGVWRSVNDIRAQAGEAKFAELLAQIESLVAGKDSIVCPYLTRAWTVRKAD